MLPHRATPVALKQLREALTTERKVTTCKLESVALTCEHEYQMTLTPLIQVWALERLQKSVLRDSSLLFLVWSFDLSPLLSVFGQW